MAHSIGRRPPSSAAGLTTSLAAIFVVTLIGAQTGRLLVPVDGLSIMGHMPMAGIRELIDMGSQWANAVGATASMAYDDISGISLKKLQDSLLGSVMGGSSPNQNNTNTNSSECRNASTSGGESGGWLGNLCPPYDPDADRNVSEIIRSRGFLAEEYDVHTADGYILTIQRIINPLVDASHRSALKPVILQHGLMSSSVDWVINSVDVKPSRFPKPSQPEQASTSEARQQEQTATDYAQEMPNSLGYYLANEGYDVFLANSRGNKYGQRHERLSTWQPSFWAFTFDEQIKYDLPAVIEFVQNLTHHTKLGYVGHSQGTTMALGLLADEPQYADVLEPVVLLAPVAYVAHCRSPVKYFAIYTPIFSHVNLWFGSSNAAVRFLGPKVCGPKVVRREICENIVFLSTGFDEAEFNDTRVSAYMSHMPSGTSVKNIAHWGQEVISGRFAHFDHGLLGNQARYGLARPPDYDISKIRSKSIALFAADNDWLAPPEDVARLRAELPEPPVKFVNVTENYAAWNHIDFLYGKDCGRLVNRHVIDVFHQFDGHQ